LGDQTWIIFGDSTWGFGYFDDNAAGVRYLVTSTWYLGYLGDTCNLAIQLVVLWIIISVFGVYD
jgi:hypothetical protein